MEPGVGLVQEGAEIGRRVDRGEDRQRGFEIIQDLGGDNWGS